MSDKNPALSAVEGLVNSGLAESDDRILGEIMEGGAGLAIAYRPTGKDLAVSCYQSYTDVDYNQYQEIYLDSSGVALLVAALVDMGLVERRKETK